MRARILRHADYQRQRWRNGGGWTTELAARPEAAGDAGGFDWRISIADIETDGPFSTFPGCDRLIALLDGFGMQLTFDAAPPERLEQRLQFVRFAGEWRAHGKLLSGPVRDFNVIFRRAAVRTEIWRRPLVGPMVFLPEDATWFAYLASGKAEVKLGGNLQTIDMGESLLLESAPGGDRVVLNGSGELALVKFAAVPA